MINPTQLPPLALAFIGDTVFDLLVREALLDGPARPQRQLHKESAVRVNARAQAELAKKILPLLGGEEAEIFRRGQNAQPGHVPRGFTRGEYALATALEALFGWLWLCGRLERARELFDYIFS
ncbi:MAG: ribonuclease III [Oscillospiraceae bacterium]|nr:ribonuclease III [Oscillospiraceae bacterium]